MVSFSLHGRLETDFNGHCQLINLFNHASKYHDCWYKIDMDSLNWIDANQTALLLTIINKLKKENGLKFFLDYHALKGDLNVLTRNGFAYYAVHNKDNFQQYDPRDSVVPIKAFRPLDADGFVKYIEGPLLKHRGLDKVKSDDKTRVKDSYFEIFDNVGIHANTTAPILACGQLFPATEILKFTLVDLGDGFLKKIAEHTKGSENIVKASDAITWAVKGGSTKTEAKGGTGLKGIMSYCFKNGGELHIVSDDCYWSFSNKSIIQQVIKTPFMGTTIHLVFRYLQTG